MMLNSFRGKYSQQGNKSEVEAISSPARLYQLIDDDSQELQTLHIMNNEMIEVVYKHIQDADPIQVNMNIFMACFTTCWARLPRGSLSTQSRTGAVLQHWFHHLLASTRQTHATPTRLSRRIYQRTQTRGSGPNNYWYRIKDGKVECKVCSFTLNMCRQEQLNFDQGSQWGRGFYG